MAKVRLETIAHVAVIVSCVFGVGIILKQQTTPAPARRPTLDSLVGKPLTLPVEGWSPASVNAVLVFSSTCHFCQESFPLYRQLAELRDKSAGRVGLVVVSGEDPELIRGVFVRESIAVDRVVKATPSSIGVRGTPAVFVMNNQRLVLRAFSGKMNGDNEQLLLASLRQ